MPLTKLREEKFKKTLIFSKEIAFFLKKSESRLLKKSQHTLSSHRPTKLVIKWLRLIENKCFRR